MAFLEDHKDASRKKRLDHGHVPLSKRGKIEQENDGYRVDHCSMSRIVAIIKLPLSTRLSFISEMKHGHALSVFLLSNSRRVCTGKTLPC
jgi:hypothetical protein